MGNLLGGPKEDGTNEGNPHNIELPVLFLLALGDLKHKFLGLEGEHYTQHNPCNHNHDDHVGNHVYAPFTKGNIDACLLQGALCGSVRRSADRRADTAKVGRHGDGQRQTDLAFIVGRKL